MLKKSFQIIKSNPVIILFYAAYLAITVMILLMLYPKSFGPETYIREGMFDFSLYMIVMGKILLAGFLMFVIGLFYLSGYGNVIRVAVVTGKASASSFLAGIKHFFVRVLLCVLLIVAIVIVGSVLLGLISIPFTILVVMSGNSSPMVFMIIVMVVTFLIVLIPTPFVILWLPALFLEDTKVIQSLKLGAKVGKKNYWRLMFATALLCFPQFIYMILNYDIASTGTILSPGYFIILVVMAILSMIYYVYLFVLFHEDRLKLTSPDQQTLDSDH